MKIACLQFAPKLGDIEGNVARANAILSAQTPEDLDLLVLPELALTDNSSLHISLQTEPTMLTLTRLQFPHPLSNISPS